MIVLFIILEFLFLAACLIDMGQALEDHGQTSRIHPGLLIFGKDCVKWKLVAFAFGLSLVHLVISWILPGMAQIAWQIISIILFGGMCAFNGRW